MKTKGAKRISNELFEKAYSLVELGYPIKAVCKECQISYNTLYNRIKKKQNKTNTDKKHTSGRKKKYDYIKLLNAIHECLEGNLDKEHVAMKYNINPKTFKAYLSLYKTNNPNVVSLISFVSEYEKKKKEAKEKETKQIEKDKNKGLLPYEVYYSNGVFILTLEKETIETETGNTITYEKDLHYIVGELSIKISPVFMLYFTKNKNVYNDFIQHIFDDIVFYEKDGSIHNKKNIKEYKEIDMMFLFAHSNMILEKMRSFEVSEEYIEPIFNIYTFIRENTANIYQQSYDKKDYDGNMKFLIPCLPIKK